MYMTGTCTCIYVPTDLPLKQSTTKKKLLVHTEKTFQYILDDNFTATVPHVLYYNIHVYVPCIRCKNTQVHVLDVPTCTCTLHGL